jgi:hypothetical protein
MSLSASDLGCVALVVLIAACDGSVGSPLGRDDSSNGGGTNRDAPDVTPAGEPNPYVEDDAAPPALPSECGGELTDSASFDLVGSEAAFGDTLHRLLTTHCSECHSSTTGHQLPLHSDPDLQTAHEAALGLVSLANPEGSLLVKRLAIDRHNCWSDNCGSDAREMLTAITNWSNAVADGIPGVAVSRPVGEVTEAQVLAAIAEDKATLASADAPYVRYTSLHELHNAGMTDEELDVARLGISKALNAHARFSPAIINPEPIDCYALVYRFDIREYWSRYLAGSEFFGPREVVEDAARALETWTRITEGNIHADRNENNENARDADGNYLYPNNHGFHDDYVEASQLAYTLTRPDVYNDVMQIPDFGHQLKAELGVDTSKGVDSYEYMVVDDAITIEPRLLLHQDTPNGRSYWESVDQFSIAIDGGANGFVFYDNPIPEFAESSFGASYTQVKTISRVIDGFTVQNQAQEIIFNLDNGLQGYAIFGAANQRRLDAFTFVVCDPERSGAESRFGFCETEFRLLNGASCHSCHSSGMKRAPTDMHTRLVAGEYDSTTTERALELYPGPDVMGSTIERDRSRFLSAMQEIADGMTYGPTSTTNQEPLRFLIERAQAHYGYADTISN